MTISTPRESPNARVMERLWMLMAGAFGQKWIKDYGLTPCEAWSFTLLPFTAEQIGAGFDLVTDADLTWPPSLSKFKSFVKEAARSRASFVDFPRVLALPPPRNTEAAIAARAEIRVLTGGGRANVPAAD